MTKLDHVHITVTNLEDSFGWYEKLFGFEPVETGTTQLGHRWAIIACNDSMIAMTEYPDKQSADKNEDRANHRIFHFGLRVENADTWRAKIKRHQLELHYGGEIEYAFSRSWYVHDPSGHEIEVSCTDGEPLRFSSNKIKI